MSAINPSDFIDPDEGRDDPRPFFTEGEPCENCGTACDAGTRVWITGFNYFGCNACAEETRILIYAEENCPTLYDAVMRSKSVAEVQRAYREHQAGCPKCNPKVIEFPHRRSGDKEAA